MCRSSLLNIQLLLCVWLWQNLIIDIWAHSNRWWCDETDSIVLQILSTMLAETHWMVKAKQQMVILYMLSSDILPFFNEVRSCVSSVINFMIFINWRWIISDFCRSIATLHKTNNLMQKNTWKYKWYDTWEQKYIEYFFKLCLP